MTDGREVYLTTNGGAELSKGGSGDTLSGVILGMLSWGNGLLESAYAAAYLTAEVAKSTSTPLSALSISSLSNTNRPSISVIPITVLSTTLPRICFV